MKKTHCFSATVTIILILMFAFCVKSATMELQIQNRYDFLQSRPLPFVNYISCYLVIIIAGLFNLANYVGKKITYKANLTAFILAVGFISFTTVNNYIYYSKEIKLLEQNYVERTFLDAIDMMLDSDTSATIYVGRGDCEFCQQAYPLIRKYAYYGQNKIYYYDTLADRAYNPTYMGTILERLDVDSVPSVVFIENGAVVQVMGFDEILKWIDAT